MNTSRVILPLVGRVASRSLRPSRRFHNPKVWLSIRLYRDSRGPFGAQRFPGTRIYLDGGSGGKKNKLKDTFDNERPTVRWNGKESGSIRVQWRDTREINMSVNIYICFRRTKVDSGQPGAICT